MRRAARAKLYRAFLNGVALILAWALSMMTLHPASMLLQALDCEGSSMQGMQHGPESRSSKKPGQPHSTAKHCEFCVALSVIVPAAPTRASPRPQASHALETRDAPVFTALYSNVLARAPPLET
jgi:hypothetical protein